VAQRLTQFDHDGYRFDVRDEGPLDGPVIIALHGWPQTSASWDGVIPQLTAAGLRVLAPDQRGYSPGARPQNIEAYRMHHLAGDVLALADAAGADTFHLLGHDWGGGVAWYLGAWHPDRVRTLSVLSIPHPRALAAAMKGRQALRSSYIAFFQLPRLPELLLRVRSGAGARRLLRRSGAPDPDQSVRLLAQPGAATATLNWYRALRIRSVRTPGMITVPTLFVWSDEDAALDRRGAEDTARWVSGPYRFEVLTGVSHWIPEERPQEVAELVLAHVRAHG
jgi:pimeloyl-ACP methyl ester carboxylesterase